MKFKHIIITGATSGLGKSLSELFIKDVNTICHYIGRNEEKLKNLRVNNKSYIYTYDLLDSNSINRLYLELSSNIGNKEIEKIIYINCAGNIEPIDKIGNLESEDIFKSIKINLESPMNIISKITKLSLSLNVNLDIINISSGASKKPLEGWSLYSSTKAGMNTFLDTLNKEYNNIRIVNFDPGVMDTKMQEYIRNINKLDFEYIDMFIRYKENNLLRKTGDVAKLIKRIYIDDWTAESTYECIKKYD